MRTILGHAEITGAITCDELLPLLAEVRSLPSVRFVIDIDGPTDGTTALSAVVGADDSTFQVPVDENDLADIMYTSGTTGLPKGVAVRHRNVAMIPNSEPTWTGDCWMHSSPLFTFAGIGFIYNPMKMGMGGLYQARFDAGRWLGYVETWRPTMCFIVPAMAQLIINHENFATADLSSLNVLSHRIGAAGAGDPAGAARQAAGRVGVEQLRHDRGRSRVLCHAEGRSRAPRRARSAFRCRRWRSGSSSPTTATSAPLRQHGEVLVRNKGRQREYYMDPEATARTWSDDGWLRTGDVGYLDEDGYLYLCGRMKEVIIRGGNNVYATDVEAVLYEHPAVLEAAAVGVPHDVFGEDVGAFVVLKPGAALQVDELVAFCAERLADYKVPRQIAFLDELPRNATGKVLKHQLKEQGWHSMS